LVSLFPEIGLIEDNFPSFPKNYWKEMKNRRIFFEDFAKQNHFDPLKPSNWLHVSKKNILAVKKGASILPLYNNNLQQALLHLFPEFHKAFGH